MKHQFAASLIWGVFVFLAAPASSQEVQDISYSLPDGTRVMQHQIVVPASVEEVWAALTTTEGIRSWAAPVTRVDFRVGGVWESSYRLDRKIGDPGNIKNRYLSFLPLRMVSIQAFEAPPSFPHPELLPELFHVIELEKLGPQKVRVTISGVGYKSGGGYDAIYAHFAAGNPWSLRKLHQRFAQGPIDWAKELAQKTGAR